MEAPDELVAFVRREQPRLVRAVGLLIGDRAVAEEVAQEALLRAASRWEQVSRLASPGGWTHRVAINLATSTLRRRAAERRARARLHADTTTDAVDATGLAVRQALASLPERQRRVLVLRHVLDWTVQEITELDGGSAQAVRQQLFRARSALRAHLAPYLDLDPSASDPEEETTDVH